MATTKKAFTLSEQPETQLGLVLNGKAVANGSHVPRKETEKAPGLTFANAKGPYLLVAIDLDAPYASMPILGPILHWMAPGVKPTAGDNPSAQTASGAQLNTAGAPSVADWIAASPPPLSGPHRYLFVLFDQPEGFDGKKFGQPAEGAQFPITKRMRFDLDRFVKEASLGEIVAAGWFTSN